MYDIMQIFLFHKAKQGPEVEMKNICIDIFLAKKVFPFDIALALCMNIVRIAVYVYCVYCMHKLDIIAPA